MGSYRLYRRLCETAGQAVTMLPEGAVYGKELSALRVLKETLTQLIPLKQNCLWGQAGPHLPSRSILLNESIILDVNKETLLTAILSAACGPSTALRAIHV